MKFTTSFILISFTLFKLIVFVVTLTLLLLLLLLSLLFTLSEVLDQHQLIVFHWSLNDSKSPQFSNTLFSILVVLKNSVVWMVYTRPSTSKSSRHINYPLVTVPKAPVTIGNIVTFMFYSFCNSLASWGTYSCFLILSVLFSGQPGQQSRQFCKFSFFLL